jgi:hypothetical protein
MTKDEKIKHAAEMIAEWMVKELLDYYYMEECLPLATQLYELWERQAARDRRETSEEIGLDVAFNYPKDPP